MQDPLLIEYIYLLGQLDPPGRWRALWQFRCAAIRSAWESKDWRTMADLLATAPLALLRGALIWLGFNP